LAGFQREQHEPAQDWRQAGAQLLLLAERPKQNVLQLAHAGLNVPQQRVHATRAPVARRDR
jgi:hypothetical protein